MANGAKSQNKRQNLNKQRAQELQKQRNQDRRERTNSSPAQKDLSSSQVNIPNTTEDKEQKVDQELKSKITGAVAETAQYSRNSQDNQKHNRSKKGNNKVKIKSEETEGAGKEAGKKIAEKLKEGEFSGFILALTLAVTKDIIIDVGGIPFDIGTGFLSSIIEGGIELFIAGAIWAIIYYSSKNFFSRWFKKLFVRFVIAFIWGFIPFIEIFPEYTLLVLWIAREKRNLRKAAEASQRELKDKMKKGKKNDEQNYKKALNKTLKVAKSFNKTKQ